MSQLTMGGVKAAQLKNTDNGDIVSFMFNPTDFTIDKSIDWTDGQEQGVDFPSSKFNRGQARTVSLTLHFDSQSGGTDVRAYTAKLWKMASIDGSKSKNAKTGKGHPPAVEFTWGNGKVYLKAIITKISEKYTLFDGDGIPLRSEMSISLKEYIPPAGGDSGSGSSPPATTTVTGADRIDNVAASSGTSHRELAANNNIDNPMNVPPGTTLQT